MTLGIVPSDGVLLAAQASLVALPRAMPQSFLSRVKRLRGRGWAAIPVVSIIGVILLIRYSSGTATWLTWLALIAVPILAFAALAWMIHGRWSWWRTTISALVGVGLFLVAWLDHTREHLMYVSWTNIRHLPTFYFTSVVQWHLPAQLAATLLTGLSCIALGVLLASVAPGGWLKIGIVLMSCADVWLISSNLLQAPNNELVAALPAPGSGLPQLQSETFAAMNMGYGDFFVAGLLGGVLAAQGAARQLAAGATGVAASSKALISAGRMQIGKGLGAYRLQLGAALMVFVIAALFDLLFFVVSELPATVPVALTVIIIEGWTWLKRRRTTHVSEHVTAAQGAA